MCAETGCRFGGSGKHDHTGYRFIDSVNEPKKDIPWFSVPVFDVLLDHFHEMNFPGFVSLDQKPGGFVHGNEVIVLVEDSKVLRGQLAWNILNHVGSVRRERDVRI